TPPIFAACVRVPPSLHLRRGLPQGGQGRGPDPAGLQGDEPASCRDRQSGRALPMPSSWSIKLAGTCRPASSCPPISPSLRCRQNAPSSIQSKTSGSLCATTGSRTASSNPTTISSTIAATLGTSSSISPGASCPLDCANGRTGSDQAELVLGAMRPDLPDEVEVTTKKQLNGEARPDLIVRKKS